MQSPMNTFRQGALALLVLGSAQLGVAHAVAQAAEFDIRYVSPSPPKSNDVAPMLWFLEEVKRRTSGRVDYEAFLGNSLVKDQNILDAVGSGVVEMGKIYTVTYPGQLPLWNIGNLPFTSSSPCVSMMTLGELRERFPSFNQETDRLNIVALGGVSTGGTELASRNPIASVDDLKGLKVRAAGLQGLAFSAVGAVPMSIPVNDLYEAMSRGVVDAATSYVLYTRPFRYNEMADYFTFVGLGQAVQGEIMNKDFWESLPADIQAIMKKTMAEAHLLYMENAQVALEKEREIVEKGLDGAAKMTFSRLPEDERARWIKMSPDFFAQWADSNGGVATDSQEIVKAFFELQKKYTVTCGEMGLTDGW